MKVTKIINKGNAFNAIPWISNMIQKGVDGGDVEITLGRPNRTSEQNARLWPYLQDISKSVDWPRGSGVMRTKEEWKLIFMSAYRHDRSTCIAGINGEFINLGLSSSKLSEPEFSELLMMIEAQGNEWGVDWSIKDGS